MSQNIISDAKNTQDMLSIVRLLEGKSARKRKRAILDYLTSRGIAYTLHRYREWFVPTDNIIVTKPGKTNRQILLLSHYDTYHGNPGANDNASSIAVALKVIERLSSESTYSTIKAIVFDDEEASPIRPNPCLGSRKYVKHNGVEDVDGVFCLELCGVGDTVVVWPVSNEDNESPLLTAISETLSAHATPYEFIPRLPGFTSDFMPFRKAGVSEAFCLSAAPSSERDELLRLFSSPILSLLVRVELPKLLGFSAHLPELIRHYHTKHDRAEHLSETSLQLVAEALYNAVMAYDEKISCGGSGSTAKLPASPVSSRRRQAS